MKLTVPTRDPLLPPYCPSSPNSFPGSLFFRVTRFCPGPWVEFFERMLMLIIKKRGGGGGGGNIHWINGMEGSEPPTVLTTIPSIILAFLPFCSSLVCSCFRVLFLLGNIAQCHGLLTMLKNISIFFQFLLKLSGSCHFGKRERKRERESPFFPLWSGTGFSPSPPPPPTIHLSSSKTYPYSLPYSLSILFTSSPPPNPNKGNSSLAAYLSSKSSGPLPLGISNDLLWRGDVNTFCSPLFFSGIGKWAKHMSTKLHTTGDFHLFLSLDYPWANG